MILILNASSSFAQILPMMGSPTMEVHHVITGPTIMEKLNGFKVKLMYEEYPLFASMGMPNSEGNVNLRITQFEQFLGHKIKSGFGANIEAGLSDRIGLLMRNDNFNDRGSEVMLQFASVRSEDKKEGISLIIGNKFPGVIGDPGQKIITGLSGTKMLQKNILHMTFRFDPTDGGSVAETSFIAPFDEHSSFVFEYLAESEQKYQISCLLGGIKYKVASYISIGIGSEVAVTIDREFETRSLMQLNVRF